MFILFVCFFAVSFLGSEVLGRREKRVPSDGGGDDGAKLRDGYGIGGPDSLGPTRMERFGECAI